MESDIIEEIFTEKSPNPVSIEGTEKILYQMRHSICKIIKKKGEKGTGFFCFIPITDNKVLPVLITNNHILNEKDIKNNETIKVTINNDNDSRDIFIDESRKKFTSIELDITIIEIKPNQDKINEKDFLNVDPDINKSKNILETLYLKKSIYVLHYQKGNEIKVSYGLSDRIKDKEILHYCNTEEGSSGSPILSLDTFQVIGIHKGYPKQSRTNKFNLGTLMKYAIKEFIEKIYNINININNNKNNEATIIYKLGDFDNEIKLFGETFVKNNKDKCVLIIDEKEHELCENINRDDITCIKKNILKIKLKEVKTITDMSYMFSNCCTLIDLRDISEWDTSSVTNMNHMFDNCEALLNLPDISKWDTSNVTDFSYMFNYCISLSTLPDISKWEIKNTSDISNMFLDCKESLNIPSKYANK